LKVLVTGSNGNLAKSITRNSVNHDFQLISRSEWNNIENVSFDGVDVIIHCAYNLKESIKDNPSGILNSNIVSTAVLLEKAKEYNVKRFIFISSCAVYGDSSTTKESLACVPKSFNGLTKKINEELIFEFCKNTSISANVLRVFNLYGGDDHFSVVNWIMKSAKENSSFNLNNDGISQRDFVHVDDVSKVVLKVIEDNVDHKVLNVGTGLSTSIKDIVSRVQSKMPVNINKTNFPEVEYSRADTDLLRTFYKDKFVNLFDYIESELKGN